MKVSVIAISLSEVIEDVILFCCGNCAAQVGITQVYGLYWNTQWGQYTFLAYVLSG